MSLMMKVTPGGEGFEFFRLSNGHEWGTAVLREWTRESIGGIVHCGQVLFHTSFGSYGYTWSDMGCRLKHFLCRAAKRGERSYIMGKLAGARRDEFDPEETLLAAKRDIRDDRRQGWLTLEEARECWTALASLDGHSHYEMIDAFSRLKPFRDCYTEMSRTRMTSECIGFWENIFLPLCAHLEGAE